MTINLNGETKIRVEWKEKVFTHTTKRGVTYTTQNQSRCKMFSTVLKTQAEKLVSELKADSNCYDVRLSEVKCGCICF